MKKDVDDFIEYCGITAGESTLKKIRNKMTYINEFFEGKLDNLTLKDLRRFLSDLNKRNYAVATQNDFIKVFKRFLKWKYRDWNERFNGLEDAKARSKDQRKLSKEDLLTLDEMEIIIHATDSFKYKTLLLLFQETGARPEELLKLVWRDISFDKKEVKLFSSKTGNTRIIPINKTIEHLRRYREECFYEPPKMNDKVFDITSQAVSNHLNKIEKKLNFSKHLYPYLWRHSVLTRMIKELSPKVYEMYAGHSLETGMKIYAHLDNEDLRKELDEKIYKIEKLTKEDNQKIKKLEEELLKNKKNIKKMKAIIEIIIKSLRRKEQIINEVKEVSFLKALK